MSKAISILAFVFALLLEGYFAKEVGIGIVEVAQRLLGSTLAALIHPSIVRLLQGIEFFVQLDSGRTFTRGTVDLLGASQTPVVSEPGCTGMLEQDCSLLIIDIQFSFIASYHFQSLLLSSLAQRSA